MRVECENARPNFLDYVTMLIDSQRFEPEMFGNSKNPKIKLSQKTSRPKPTRNLPKESYVETETLNEDKDYQSVSSYKSTETVVDIDTQENQTESSNEAGKQMNDKTTEKSNEAQSPTTSFLGTVMAKI